MPEVGLLGERRRRRREDDGLSFDLPQADSGYASYTTPGYQPSDEHAPIESGGATIPNWQERGTRRPGQFPTGGVDWNQPTPWWYDQPRPGSDPVASEQPQAAGPFDLGAFQRSYEGLIGQSGRAGTMDEYNQFIFPELQRLFPQIQRFGSKGDKIRFPGGETFDAVLSAGLGGRGYNPFGLEGAGGGGASAPAGGGFVFDDPYGQQLERLARSRIESLFQPQGQGPEATSAFDYYRKLFGDLQATPGYSPQERALLQTQVSEPIEARRTASKQRALERASSRGYAPTSGLLELDVRDIERGADEARAVADRNLGIHEIARRDARQRQAMQVADYLRMAEEARTLLQEGRYREALQIADRMQALPGERLSLANQTLGTQPASAGAYSTSLYNANQANQYNQAQLQQFWMMLAQALSGLGG